MQGPLYYLLFKCVFSSSLSETTTDTADLNVQMNMTLNVTFVLPTYQTFIHYSYLYQNGIQKYNTKQAAKKPKHQQDVKGH